MGFNKNEGNRSSYKLESQACLPGSFIYTNSNMNRKRLSKLSKSRLIARERDSAKSHNGLSVKPKAVIPAKFNPKSLTELSANKLEQMIQPKLTKPKSLVQLAAEEIDLEQSIKQTTKLPEPSKMLPTLKTLAAQALVKDKVKFWNEKANNDASINRLDKNTMRRGRRPTPIPALRTKKQQPVAVPRTKIDEKRRPLKGERN